MRDGCTTVTTSVGAALWLFPTLSCGSRRLLELLSGSFPLFPVVRDVYWSCSLALSRSFLWFETSIAAALWLFPGLFPVVRTSSWKTQTQQAGHAAAGASASVWIREQHRDCQLSSYTKRVDGKRALHPGAADVTRSEREPTAEDEKKAIDTETCSSRLQSISGSLAVDSSNVSALRGLDANCLLLDDTAGRSGRPAGAAVSGLSPNVLPLQ
ncbi:hypothetical protein MRX96_040107 [Rhipicephalus microplus]